MVPHILIVGSAPVDLSDLTRAARAADLVVCADGGADVVLSAHIVPVAVIGDMDSISLAAGARLDASRVRILEYPPDKDKTDLELALDFALTLDAQRITVLGALGGARLDHTLGNVMLLALPSLKAIDVRMLDRSGEALAVWSRRTIDGMAGDYVSLMPLTSCVTGVVTAGLKYSLAGDTLMQGSTRGISNELVDTHATIGVDTGCLLVRHERSR